MAMHLLSLLDDIEQALIQESASLWGKSCDVHRVFNSQHNIGRITLTPPAGANPTQLRGVVFLQGAVLADGSLKFRASFNWHGSDAFPVISISAKPDAANWKTEAARIASVWLAGPPAPRVTSARVKFSPSFAFAS